MLGWLREKAEQKIVQSHLSEMMPYLRQLSSISDDEVALIYLHALSYRNITKKHTSMDLFKIKEAIEKNRMLAVRIGKEIRDHQNSSLYVSAAGLKVWLFTIRSVMYDELRPIGLGLWRELPRGFPYVHTLSRQIFEQSGIQNDLTDFGAVPVGFGKTE
jgi:hypothetical protein